MGGGGLWPGKSRQSYLSKCPFAMTNYTPKWVKYCQQMERGLESKRCRVAEMHLSAWLWYGLAQAPQTHSARVLSVVVKWACVGLSLQLLKLQNTSNRRRTFTTCHLSSISFLLYWLWLRHHHLSHIILFTSPRCRLEEENTIKRNLLQFNGLNKVKPSTRE